ncbi:S26 family signal peptidase [Porphyrobacter algicida]|uniref:S26 family signal peptidase n=1 Tax=Qipengyuania algicida TaxID=1836209 RepID=A0A845ALY3_9SPHN|nr:S26 family signal peptidase [Qipengyuania algicida]MXP30173.1 S26 family signal peptidase [Qipengyuania algicida]
MRKRFVILAGGVIVAALLSAALPFSWVLVWNATASVPTGLYLIRGQSGLHVDERVAIDPPPALRDYLAERGYLPSGVPLLKEVAALSGETVCRTGTSITIGGKLVGHARESDSAGRPLPIWQGCQTIAEDEIFVMNLSAPGSFDGRYFGPVKRGRIIGRAIPVWTDEAGSSEHVWFAEPPIPDNSLTTTGDNP